MVPLFKLKTDENLGFRGKELPVYPGHLSHDGGLGIDYLFEHAAE
jgi:hypothetical protein